MQGRKELRYSLIFDSELFLNFGRLTSIGIVAAAAFFLPLKAALIYGSIAIVHVFLIAAYSLKRKPRGEGLGSIAPRGRLGG